MTNLVVVVRNEFLTDEEVAAAVAQASTAYLLSLVRTNAHLRDDTERDVYGRDTAHTDENGVLLYKNPVLYALAKKAAAEGRSTFHTKTIKDGYSYKTIPCKPEPYYDVRLRLTPTIEEGLRGDRDVQFLDCKESLKSVIAAARGMGWREGKDYFCFENSVGFRPISSEELHAFTKNLGAYAPREN